MARELAPGKPCPVCGALEHPAPCQLTQENQQLNREQLEKLRKTADDAAKAQEEKAKESESAQAKLTERQKLLKKRKKAGRECEEHPRKCADGNGGGCGSDADGVAAGTAKRVEVGSGEGGRTEESAGESRRREGKARTAGKGSIRRAGDGKIHRSEKAEAEKTWNLHQEELSSSAYRTRGDAVAQRTQAQEAKQKAETAASQAAEKERQAQKAETDCETQIRRLNEEMPQKQANAEEFNQQYQQTMAEKSLDETQWRQLAADYDAEEPDHLQKKVNDFDQKKNTAETQCTTAQSAIAGREKPDMAKLEAASKAAESALKEVSDALETAKHLHSDNARVLKDLRDGRDPLAKACKEANTAQHLSDVMAGTESGNRMNLETFVQRNYMEKFCATRTGASAICRTGSLN